MLHREGRNEPQFNMLWKQTVTIAQVIKGHSLVVGVWIIDILGPEKRRRRTVQEKIAIVQQSFEQGMTVSVVARQNGVAASQLFLWRQQYQEGSLTAVASGEQVVLASELASAMKQIKELQRLLGKKTMEVELLKEAVDIGRQKSG